MSEDSRYKEVQADKWSEMSSSDLYEQLSILRSRAYTASTMSNIPMLEQINRGIKQLESVIASKSDDDGTVTL
jgi:hypothetical protein